MIQLINLITNRLKVGISEKYIYNPKFHKCRELIVINTECLPLYNYGLIFLIYMK